MTRITVEPEKPSDCPSIDALHETAFGPGRFARTAYRLREMSVEATALAHVARLDGRLIGSVRLFHITIGPEPALLLGPLAVDPDKRGQGAGKALVRKGLEAARLAGHRLVVLVGDAPYYGPLGFQPTVPGSIVMPGPVDPHRLLIATLNGAGAATGPVAGGQATGGENLGPRLAPLAPPCR